MKGAHQLNPKRGEEKSCIGEFFKWFDFYKDLPDSLSEPTLTGASISIALMGIIALLLVQHTYAFLSFQKSSEIMIDVNSGEEKLHINMDITLPKCPCAPLSLDIVDVTGVHVVDIEGKLQKIRLDKHGKEIGAVDHIDEEGHAEVDAKSEMSEEFRATSEGQQKTEKVVQDSIASLNNQEGCKLSGFVFINKVPGNFHISGHHFPEAVQRLYMQGHRLDFSHKINHLSFGELQDIKYIENNFSEKFKFELDGRDTPQSKFMPAGGGMFMGPDALAVNYFLEISQVDYVDSTSPAKEGEELAKYEAFRFRSSQTIKLDQGMPAIFFRYELSPIRIQYTVSLQSFTTYMVNICAVIGGIYAVSSILDSVVRNSLGILGFGSPDDLPGHGTTHSAAKRQAMKRVKRAGPAQPHQNDHAGSGVVHTDNTVADEKHLLDESGEQIEMPKLTGGQ